MNTKKAAELGDFLSLFNYPMPQAPPTPQAFMPPMQIQQVPPGGQGFAGGQPPQGMVQVSTGLPTAPAAGPAQQFAPQPQLTPQPQFVPQPQFAPQAPLVAPQPQLLAPQAPMLATPAGVEVPGMSVGVPAAPPQQQQAAPVPSDLVQQNEAYRAQVAQLQATQQAEAAEQQRAQLAAMRPSERQDAKLDLILQSTRVATERAQQYQVAYERERLMNQYDKRLMPDRLDLSSVDALQASIPASRQAYAEFENEVAGRLASQMGMQQQMTVEGLPPAPVVNGLPASNRGGAVPSVQGGMAPQQQMQHPQMQRDNVFQYSTNPAYGRVYQPQPGQMPQHAAPANGQYFQPQYHQPPHMQMQQQMSPQVQLVPAQAPMAQPMPMVDVEGAKSSARNSIMAARKGGMNRLQAMGMGEGSGAAFANANPGAAPMQHTSMPNPAQFAGHETLHPMHLASGGN